MQKKKFRRRIRNEKISFITTSRLSLPHSPHRPGLVPGPVRHVQPFRPLGRHPVLRAGVARWVEMQIAFCCSFSSCYPREGGDTVFPALTFLAQGVLDPGPAAARQTGMT